MKKVSVIVPVYGVEKYIAKCLDSLVNQTLKDIEIIVVNDGSPDNSQKIIDKYVKKYPDKVKSYIKENGGQGSARNYGLAKAKGEYIGYVDSDDFINLNMYEKLYNKAKEKDNLDVVICGAKKIYDDNYNTAINPLFLKTNNNKTNAFFGDVGVCNKIYKKEILLNNKLAFRENVWYEDLAFTCKVIINSQKIDFINEPLYNYLVRKGSTMNNSNINRNLEILDAFDDILEYINSKKQYSIYYSYIEYLAIYHIFIVAITRVINIKGVKGKKQVIDKMQSYMKDKFPNYRKNKYIYLLDKNKKIVYNIISVKQYWLVRLIFIMKEALK